MKKIKKLDYCNQVVFSDSKSSFKGYCSAFDDENDVVVYCKNDEKNMDIERHLEVKDEAEFFKNLYSLATKNTLLLFEKNKEKSFSRIQLHLKVD